MHVAGDGEVERLHAPGAHGGGDQGARSSAVHEGGRAGRCGSLPHTAVAVPLEVDAAACTQGPW